MSIATFRPIRGAAGAALVAMLVAACGPGATPTSPPAATSEPTQAPASLGPVTSPAASQPASSSATVSVANGILVGPTGMALYTKSGDTATSSTCSAGCLAAWPALTVPAGTTPTAGTGASAALATFTRADNG